MEDDCYFDLSAFFDGIPHQRCLASLHAHGVFEKGRIHRWIRAWLGAGGESLDQGRKLLRRRQKVTLNGQSSEWHDVTASIIQGSCLGPTLAKCFSNTSHKGRNLLPEDKPLVSKFADDEKRCRIVKHEEQGERMQADINQMVDWTLNMGVELNQEKVHLLHIGRGNPKRGYTLGEEGPAIVSVEHEKDLGVIISNDLKPDKMVNKQSQRGHLKLSQFNTAFTYRGNTWLKLYKTYIKPSLMYASEAWRPTTKEGIEKLESVQRRALKMAGRLEGRTSYREACRKEGMNTVEEDLEEADLVRTFRIFNGNDNLKTESFWKLEEARQGAGRRRFKEKEIKRTIGTQRKDIRKRSFGSRIQDPWNQLEDSVKQASNPKSFRTSYRKSKNLV